MNIIKLNILILLSLFLSCCNKNSCEKPKTFHLKDTKIIKKDASLPKFYTSALPADINAGSLYTENELYLSFSDKNSGLTNTLFKVQEYDSTFQLKKIGSSSSFKVSKDWCVFFPESDNHLVAINNKDSITIDVTDEIVKHFSSFYIYNDIVFGSDAYDSYYIIDLKSKSYNEITNRQDLKYKRLDLPVTYDTINKRFIFCCKIPCCEYIGLATISITPSDSIRFLSFPTDSIFYIDQIFAVNNGFLVAGNLSKTDTLKYKNFFVFYDNNLNKKWMRTFNDNCKFMVAGNKAIRYSNSSFWEALQIINIENGHTTDTIVYPRIEDFPDYQIPVYILESISTYRDTLYLIYECHDKRYIIVFPNISVSSKYIYYVIDEVDKWERILFVWKDYLFLENYNKSKFMSTLGFCRLDFSEIPEN